MIMEMNDNGCVLIKLYFQRKGAVRIWPTGNNLPIPPPEELK
jgi:hypothetical protein